MAKNVVRNKVNELSNLESKIKEFRRKKNDFKENQKIKSAIDRNNEQPRSLSMK